MGDRRKCQTYTASPAEPGGLPVMLEAKNDGRSIGGSLNPQLKRLPQRANAGTGLESRRGPYWPVSPRHFV